MACSSSTPVMANGAGCPEMCSWPFQCSDFTKDALRHPPLPRELIGRCHQGAAVRWIGGAMAAIGGDDELGFGPFTVQRPGAFHGADHIVTALHDDTGDVANPRGVAEQLVVRFQKALVGKVVGLNTREGESELILLVAAGKCRIG